MTIRLNVAFASLALMLLLPGSASWSVAAEEAAAPVEDAVFEMREISTLKPSAIVPNYRLALGGYASCSEEPDKEVKAYPKLNSKHPLYGKLSYCHDLATGKSLEMRFVLDESGEALAEEAGKQEPPEETPPAKKEKAEPSLLESILGAITDSKTTETPLKKEPKRSSYDRLYLDVNRDLDLTNDPVLKPMNDPPWRVLPPWETAERMAFEMFDLDIDFGPDVGVKPLRIFPWLTIAVIRETGKIHQTMHFALTTARQGRIRIGQAKYDAVLAQPYMIWGRFDSPGASLFLKPVDPKDRIEYEGFAAESLMSVHRIGDTLYTTTATPLGDKVTVKPYRGDVGILKIGAGGRDIKQMGMRGSLSSKTMAIGLKSRTKGEQAEKTPDVEYAEEYELPVGDYVPSYAHIQYDSLRIGFSDNYHADGVPRTTTRTRNYFIQIRKDKPFVLDFSNKPDVLFASPAKDKAFKPGDEISVKAVLIDPQCDIMIRDLNDTSQKKKEIIKQGDGKESTYERDLSLDPTVTITDSTGKTVAEGLMPFG